MIRHIWSRVILDHKWVRAVLISIRDGRARKCNLFMRILLQFFRTSKQYTTGSGCPGSESKKVCVVTLLDLELKLAPKIALCSYGTYSIWEIYVSKRPGPSDGVGRAAGT